ncbi:Na+/H+ antiporter NhaA [Streptomyces sp. DSM 44915]|uniref:Na(+)/H(+) antiporter NhaA n=1 Tax=Streptomyces chisholmiae TaxID=3075540 RepID=A0ABU2JSL0_9ACTN|nr:Na+/H+ antiporter NhaA [Streptomyces sp. DSM 44915]MDT0267907.1 Na+/H+ antiporter NhaA [Streptomyces sp. DSM 44915]
MTPPSLPQKLPKAAKKLTLRDRDRRSVAEFLRLEVTGGLLLLIAATLALVLVNSPWGDGYESLRDHHLAIPFLGLDLSVGHWASDGLLAIFFFVAGTELKRELTVGELRRPAAAALPVVAAIGGMLTPALFYLVWAVSQGGGTDGWAVPMATDIAFALGVLAVVGRRLPSALRVFLLTLAIVDDLIAILVIAVFFTSGVDLAALAGAVAGLVLFRLLHGRGVRGWWWYLPLAAAVWVLMYHSGVHATIAGVALGLLLRATPGDDEDETPAEHVGHLVHPVSAGFAVPVFAFFAAGVPVSPSTLGEMAGEPEALGVVLGLFLGKLVGVLGATYLMVRFTRARLNPQLGWPDVTGVALLAGIGFTVSLLIAELAFADDPTLTEHVKAAVLVASLLAAATAAVMLTLRGRALDRRDAATAAAAAGKTTEASTETA